MSFDAETELVGLMAQAIAEEIDREILADLMTTPRSEHDFVSIDPQVASRARRVVPRILAQLGGSPG